MELCGHTSQAAKLGMVLKHLFFSITFFPVPVELTYYWRDKNEQMKQKVYEAWTSEGSVEKHEGGFGDAEKEESLYWKLQGFRSQFSPNLLRM